VVKINRSLTLIERLLSNVRNETDLRVCADALVFAPHQDDETLGCAGTILLKRRKGARVACVFMTDGSTSHSQFISENDLADIRRTEAQDATAALGIGSADVHFLGFKDGRLASCHDDAVERVKALLVSYRPAEIYVPYRNDGVADHEVTYSIVVDACRRTGLTTDVCEYPIWAWNQWPWVSLQLGVDRGSVDKLLTVLKCGFGWSFLKAFRTGIDIADVIEQKRHVLGRYRSQVQPLAGHDGWPTLGGVADGEFLDCFFRKFELFRCTKLETSA
jgi:LmbE family N-acetylglucosaminyl deacetylase